MRSALIRLTNVALFIAACWLVSVVFNQIMAERLRPPGISVYEVEPQTLESAPAWSEREVIIDRNLFGAKVASERKQPSPVVVEKREEVEETKLPLQLLGTLWSSDSTMSTAAIRDTGNRIDQVVAVGESLEERGDVQVAVIERGRVILLNGSRREELLLSEDAGSAGAGAPAASRSSRASRGSSQSGPGSPAASRRAARTSRAEKQARKRGMSGQERFAEMNKLATGRQPKTKPPPAPKARATGGKPNAAVTPQEQAEAGRVMKSLLDSGASPEEIVQRMQELENRHLGGK